MKRVLLATLVVALSAGQLSAQQHTRDGAVVGGTAGAIIGGIIGHQNDETPEGAIIGGVVGAVAGGLMGKAKDQQVQRERYYQNRIYQQDQQLQAYQQRAVRMSDVISMSQSGLGEAVIINHVQTNGLDRKLEVNDIIYLHQQGVSERVITAMQNAPLAGAQPAPVYRTQRVVEQPTVIIEERYGVLPPPPCYHYPMSRQSIHYYQFRR